MNVSEPHAIALIIKVILVRNKTCSGHPLPLTVYSLRKETISFRFSIYLVAAAHAERFFSTHNHASAGQLILEEIFNQSNIKTQTLKKPATVLQTFGGERTPYHGEWPERVDERIAEDPDKWIHSTCVLCSNGCGLEIGVKDNKIVGVRGRANDRVNKGRLGPKGLHGWIANNCEDRLTKPLIRRNGKLEEATWEEAMSLIVQKSKKVVAKHTASAIGFYTTGQLFLEEYYAQAIVGKAGLGTPHIEGNTRLCTATSAAALKLSFGTDGQPGSYTEYRHDRSYSAHRAQHCFTANSALDAHPRQAGRPEPTEVGGNRPTGNLHSQKATVHLAPRVGTNVPVMNGLINLIIEAGQIDKEYIEAHTIGFESLKKPVSKWTPEKVEELSGVPAEKLRAAAEILGSCSSMVTTALQGVYQSMQATAVAVQVNNLHLIRGMIGRDGCGIYQMNGQPTAQNTRECGADGDLPGFRNWENPDHVKDLARVWNADPAIIPHWAPPTHAMQIFRYCSKGSIKMLWISATNPAVSLPNLPAIREVLEKEDLFVVVQDAFMTETTIRADVVLPASIWGEKTGCFTNVDRTVHISHKAIDPPGEARSDFNIFVDYSNRMGFKDKDGNPLINWKTPEDAFEAWKECTRGR